MFRYKLIINLPHMLMTFYLE